MLTISEWVSEYKMLTNKELYMKMLFVLILLFVFSATFAATRYSFCSAIGDQETLITNCFKTFAFKNETVIKKANKKCHEWMLVDMPSSALENKLVSVKSYKNKALCNDYRFILAGEALEVDKLYSYSVEGTFLWTAIYSLE